MKPHTVERLINANVELKNHYTDDSPESIRADLEMRELLTYCNRRAWSYVIEENGYFTIYPITQTENRGTNNG